jgi:tetratricopeptide (TPR) repeat protein
LQAHADRYTYLPQIGLSLALTWLVAEGSAGWRCRGRLLGGGSAVLLAALAFGAHVQTARWRNSETLWTRALAATPDNPIADTSLGNALLDEGRADQAIARFQQALQIKPDDADAQVGLGCALIRERRLDEAMSYFQQALKLKPDDAEALNNLGDMLAQKGRTDEAITEFQRALQTKPDDADAHYNLANALGQKGEADAAIAHYQMALAIKPDYAAACYNLGNTLFQKGELDEAMARYQQALQIKPDYANARYNLGMAFIQKGRPDEAIPQFQKALEIKPGFPEALNELAWELATAPTAAVRDGQQAVELAQRAAQLAGGTDPGVLGTLAAAYAEAGRFEDAVASARKAIDLARATGRQDQLARLDGELKLFEAGLPFHQESK